MPKTIVIVTTGQPSTNPRMVKEYTALKEEGYNVKVFYSYWQAWAVEADKQLFQSGSIDRKDFMLVGGSPLENKAEYLLSKLRHKISRLLLNKFGFQLFSALARTTSHLIKAAKEIKADLYIAHNLGALPVAVIAAKKNSAIAGFDAEDFHRGEYKDQNSKEAMLAKQTEDKYLLLCDYITAASPLIADAYKKLYPQQNVFTIHNVFSKKFLQQFNESLATQPLTLFWFSQTIGANRGLETVVKAMESLQTQCRIDLYLMGNVATGYDEHLFQLITNKNSIHFLSLVSPDEVFAESAKYDIGLSLEVPYYQNRDLCLTNKLFTYLLAGNCIILSDTTAQKGFLKTYPGAGFLYKSDDEQQLADILLNLYNNRSELNDAKKRSLKLGEEVLNWEAESKAFKLLICEQLN